MIECDQARCRIGGAVTVDTAGGLLRELGPALATGIHTLDFSEVDTADSAALALVFGAMRQARAAGHTLACTGLPASFHTLAELYGVADLLPA